MRQLKKVLCAISAIAAALLLTIAIVMTGLVMAFWTPGHANSLREWLFVVVPAFGAVACGVIAWRLLPEADEPPSSGRA